MTESSSVTLPLRLRRTVMPLSRALTDFLTPAFSRESTTPIPRGTTGTGQLAVPAFVVPTQTLSSLHILWTVPAFGRVILEVDNDGQGYAVPLPGGYLVLNLNHEAARSEVARLEYELDLFTGQGYVISTTVEAKLTLAEAALAAGEAHLNASPPEMAAAVQDFNEAVAHALFGQEILYLDKAEADIPRYRKGTLTLSLRYANGEPIAGAVVTYQQRTHDFLFSTGYLTTDGWNYDSQLGDLMEQMGANGASVMLEHAVFEPEPGVYDWTFLDQHSGLNPLLGKGWRIMGALAYYGSSGQAFDCPAYWSSHDLRPVQAAPLQSLPGGRLSLRHTHQPVDDQRTELAVVQLPRVDLGAEVRGLSNRDGRPPGRLS